MNVDLNSFLDVLQAEGPAGDRAASMALYGQFIGSWETDVVSHERNGTKHYSDGEIHFGWVLEGRAIQDVWMIPRRAERHPGIPPMQVAGNWYGTTLRVYDPKMDAWHVLWIDPANQVYTRQVGRARGADIVQEGKMPDGATLRWSFPPSTGWVSARTTRALPGGCKWKCSRGAPGSAQQDRSGERAKVVPAEGFEPPTNGLQNRCSTPELSRRPVNAHGLYRAPPRPAKMRQAG